MHRQGLLGRRRTPAFASVFRSPPSGWCVAALAGERQWRPQRASGQSGEQSSMPGGGGGGVEGQGRRRDMEQRRHYSSIGLLSDAHHNYMSCSNQHWLANAAISTGWKSAIHVYMQSANHKYITVPGLSLTPPNILLHGTGRVMRGKKACYPWVWNHMAQQLTWTCTLVVKVPHKVEFADLIQACIPQFWIPVGPRIFSVVSISLSLSLSTSLTVTDLYYWGVSKYQPV